MAGEETTTHQGEAMKIIDNFAGEYKFLSNFSYSTVSLKPDLVHDGDLMREAIKVKTVEHGFQAAKALSLGEVVRIANAKGPGDAKYLGRRTQLRPDWESIKVHVMRELLRDKFSQPLFAELLMDTYPAILVEGNTWGDRIWGVCDGHGYNWLGLLLMEVRNEVIDSLEEEAT